jgi:hypothetical protein
VRKLVCECEDIVGADPVAAGKLAGGNKGCFTCKRQFVKRLRNSVSLHIRNTGLTDDLCRHRPLALGKTHRGLQAIFHPLVPVSVIRRMLGQLRLNKAQEAGGSAGYRFDLVEYLVRRNLLLGIGNIALDTAFHTQVARDRRRKHCEL